MSFEGKVVIVTGAASGIGAATALRFAKLSAHVALVDINEEQLKVSLALCEEKKNGKHLAIVADFSKDEEVLTVVPKTIERYGKIDILVNVAGTVTMDNIIEEDIIANYNLVMSVNLKAPIILTNKAARYLVETKGNIVNVASFLSARPAGNVSTYCVSKAGLEMFTKCVAIDLGMKGVRANSVHPGFVKTNIHHNTKPPGMEIEEYFDIYNQRLPFGLIQPEDIANLITFIASDEAKHISGSSYYMDGGISVTHPDLLSDILSHKKN